MNGIGRKVRQHLQSPCSDTPPTKGNRKIIWYLRTYLSFFIYSLSKYLWFFRTRTSTGRVRVKAIGKQEILDAQIEQELQESRRRWRNDTEVISRIVQLEKELGHPPTLLDLFCRFERAEIAALSDLLPWLNEEEEIRLPQQSITASAADPTSDDDDNDLATCQQENPVKIMASSDSEIDQLNDASQYEPPVSESGSDLNAR